jgi:hypothetical protein
MFIRNRAATGFVVIFNYRLQIVAVMPIARAQTGVGADLCVRPMCARGTPYDSGIIRIVLLGTGLTWRESGVVYRTIRVHSCSSVVPKE